MFVSDCWPNLDSVLVMFHPPSQYLGLGRGVGEGGGVGAGDNFVLDRYVIRDKST